VDEQAHHALDSRRGRRGRLRGGEGLRIRRGRPDAEPGGAPIRTRPVPSEEERAFHRGLFIADLHADTLKWDRDMLVRSAYGHVDLPRLEAGHVGLQVFAMVTHSPVNLPWTDCLSARDPNHAAWLAAVQGRPVRSTRARAFHQIDRFHDAVHRSAGASRPGAEAGAGCLRTARARRRAGARASG
jgi:membrane dipeptidase